MRATWLVLSLVTLACGGRALDEGDDSVGGAGGRSTRTQGGARSGDGGASTVGGAMSTGGAFTSGGALASGGVATSGGAFASGGVTAEGGEGSTPPPSVLELMKFCGDVCTYTAKVCGYIKDPDVCTKLCVADTSGRDPTCQWRMFALLQRISYEFGHTAVSCWGYQRALEASRPETEFASKCGLSLPGTEYCSTTFTSEKDACTRTSTCGDQTFTAHCTIDPNSSYSNCQCSTNGDASITVQAGNDATFDCGHKVVEMSCSPDLSL